MKSDTGEVAAWIGWFAMIGFLLLGAIGWILNVVAIAKTDYFSGMVVLRAIGVFIAPLGAVLGWI